MQKTSPGRALVFCATLFAVAILALVMVIQNTRPREIPIGGGRSVEWLGVSTGTNQLRYGSPLQRILGYFVPYGGVAIAGMYFPSPEILAGPDDVDATAWLVVHGTGVSPQGFNNYWEGSEVITSNRTGRQFSLTPPQPFRKYSNQVVLSIPLAAFPRDQKTVLLELSPPAEHEMKRRWIEFEFENPFRSSRPIWTGASPPVTNHLGGSEFVLSSAEANKITFKVPSDDWWISACRIADDEGNKYGLSSVEWREKGSVKVWFNHWLETNRVWRVQATFVKGNSNRRRESKFTEEERRTVHLTPNAPEVTLTNGAGELFFCRLTNNTLRVHNPHGIGRPNWVVLSATDGNAEPIAIPKDSASMSGHGGSEIQVWHLRKTCTILNLELACPPVLTGVFMVRPDRNFRSSLESTFERKDDHRQ
jgi:hypothetical protein